jgi:hypothetical protein
MLVEWGAHFALRAAMIMTMMKKQPGKKLTVLTPETESELAN